MNNPNSTLEIFLNVRRTFSAPRDLVFRAWTEAQALEGWFKPMGQQTRVTELDLRVGGGYRFEIITPEGAPLSISGRYLEVARPEKLVFTWVSQITDDEETVVSIDFVEQGSSTEILLTHERFTTEDMMTSHLAGWNWMLDHLTTFL